MTEVDIQTMIDSLRRLASPKFAADVAKEAAAGVLAAVQTTAAAGQTPSGEAWRARKEDGGRALAEASKAITVRVLGTIVQLQLAYPYSIHHYQEGTATRPRRQILPEGTVLPSTVNEAVQAAAARVFARAMGGA